MRGRSDDQFRPDRREQLARTGSPVERDPAALEKRRRLDSRWSPSLHQTMNAFTDLFRSPSPAEETSPGQRQQAIDARFPSLVAGSPFRLWRPGDPFPQAGRRLLVGVATWSALDMALLDALAEAMREPPVALTVDVFNSADVVSHAGFESYVPGISPVFHTPVVGLWSEGRLTQAASGKAGRDLLGQLFQEVHLPEVLIQQKFRATAN